MNTHALTDKRIGKELGNRIKALRLRKNITQQALADTTMLSLNTIKSLEDGKGKLSTLIAVLRGLDALDHFNNFIPDVSISPLQLSKSHGKRRERASGKRVKDKLRGKNHD